MSAVVDASADAVLKTVIDPTVLNSLTQAEVVFAPFHDPVIDLLAATGFENINGTNCRVTRGWCSTVLTWDGCPAGREAARLVVPVKVPLKNYETLILCVSLPIEVRVQFSACIDGKWQRMGGPVAGNNSRQELQLSISGEWLEGVKAEFTAQEDGPHRISLSWFGLGQNELDHRHHSA